MINGKCKSKCQLIKLPSFRGNCLLGWFWWTRPNYRHVKLRRHSRSTSSSHNLQEVAVESRRSADNRNNSRQQNAVPASRQGHPNLLRSKTTILNNDVSECPEQQCLSTGRSKSRRRREKVGRKARNSLNVFN